MNNRKRVIYIGILLIVTVIVSITTFSYAYLTRIDEQHGKLNMTVGNLDYKIESDDLTNNSITLAPSESKEIEITIKSLNDIESKYQLYIKSVENVEIGYIASENPTVGTMLPNEIKRVKVMVKNISSTDKTIEFGIQSGFVSNSLVLDENRVGLEQYCNHDMCDWFATNDYQGYSIQEVLTDSTKLSSMMSNPVSVNYLLSNSDTINALKSSEYYDDYVVPVMLNYAKTSPQINTTMYNAKLPAYIYNYGTYYLINSFTYVSPANSCQNRSFNNTIENGLYFYLIGTTSASQSIGTNYSEQSINPYGYTKLVVDYNFTRDISADYSKVRLCNGTVSRVNWSATMSDCIGTLDLEANQTSSSMDMSGFGVNSNYRVVLEQMVNLFQTSGNYKNIVNIYSMYLS